MNVSVGVKELLIQFAAVVRNASDDNFAINKISVSDGSLRIPPLSHIIYSPNGLSQKTGSRGDTREKEVPTIGHFTLIKLKKYTSMMCIC